MTGPTFIGIGAQRAATSWMYECLKQHPQVFLPMKEMHFFDHGIDRGAEWYVEQFSGCPAEALAAGEFTPDYLSCTEAHKRISEIAPEAKLIAILREPVARAFSAYELHRSHGHYRTTSFEDAMTPDSMLVQGGLYGRQLNRLYQHFPKEQVLVLLHDNAKKSPLDVMRQVFEWIGVDSTFVPPAVGGQYNLSTGSRWQAAVGLPSLHRRLKDSSLAPFYHRLRSSALANKVRRSLAFKQERKSRVHLDSPRLKHLFEEDLELLARTVDLDISHWISLKEEVPVTQ